MVRGHQAGRWEVGLTLGAGDHHDTVGLRLLLGRHAHALRRIDLVHGSAHLLVRLDVRHLRMPQRARCYTSLSYITMWQAE